MFPEWIVLLPQWLTAGLAAGLALSVVIAGLFVAAARLSPMPASDPSERVSGVDRRRAEIREYLGAIDEPFLEDHAIRGETSAFYLPRRDVAITFDAQAYFRLADTPTHPVLCEHEMPGSHLGRRIPFETPAPERESRFEEAARDPVEAAFRRLDLPTGADAESITDAYREKVKEVHPDQGGDREEFRRVREAYATAKNHAE